MFQEILTAIFYFLLISISCFGYGIAFNKIFLNKDNLIESEELGIIGIYGFLFLSFISIFFHFFINLGQFFNSIIVTLGLIISVYRISLLSNFFKKDIILILIFILPTLVFFEYHADYFWYHLPYINLVNEFKIIFGLANINDNLGYGHIWYDLVALFNLPYFGTRYLSIISIIFFTYFIIFLKNKFSFTKNKLIKFFTFFSFCFVCLAYSNSKDFGSEIQGNLIYIIISLLILENYIFKDLKIQKKIILHIIILYFFAVIIRTNSIIFIPLIIIFLISNYRAFIYTLVKNYSLYIFLLIFSSLFLLKNFIITGCLSYPIYFTCFDTIEWGLGIDQAKLRFYHLSAQSKGYLLFLINESYISNIFDYYNFRKSEEYISPEIYLNDYNWLNYWWKYEYDINRFLNIFYFFIFSFLIIFLFNLKYNFIINLINNIKVNYFIIFMFSSSLLSWLILLPQTRYGGYAIFFVIICYCTLLIFYNLKNINLIPFLIILIISISYFETKNLQRILNNYYSLNQAEEINFYSYPDIKDYQFEVVNKFDLKIIKRVINEKELLGKPLYCFNIKGLCGSSFRLDCLEKLYIKNNYIYILPDKNKCALIIDKYLWY